MEALDVEAWEETEGLGVPEEGEGDEVGDVEETWSAQQGFCAPDSQVPLLAEIQLPCVPDKTEAAIVTIAQKNERIPTHI